MITGNNDWNYNDGCREVNATFDGGPHLDADAAERVHPGHHPIHERPVRSGNRPL